MYDITIYPGNFGPWCTQVYAGVFNLGKSGKAHVKISSELHWPELIDSTAVLLDVKEHKSGRKRTILIELTDGSRFSAPLVAEKFDLLAKRSYGGAGLKELPDDIRHKVIPYGINMNCNSPETPITKLFTAHHLIRLKNIGKPTAQRGPEWWQHQLRFLMYFVKNNLSLYESDFEGTPSDPVEHDIFFLTRLFEIPGKPGELTKFSNERIELVKALKQEYKHRFRGGIVASNLAKNSCPTELLYQKISRREFTQKLRNSNIVISTLGVLRSTPWKLGEAIAAASCIVSEPLFFELPVPLENNIHLKEFTSNEECLNACEELLSHPDKIKEMKDNVWAYYNQHVKAEKLIERIIEQAFKS